MAQARAKKGAQLFPLDSDKEDWQQLQERDLTSKSDDVTLAQPLPD